MSPGDSPAPLRADVWFASAERADRRLVDLLDERERERLRAFRHAPSQRSYLVAAAMLRTVVAGCVGEAPGSVRLDRTCSVCGRPHGRPRVVEHPWLSCSVSHSGEQVAVALVRGAGVGVDVECTSSPRSGGLRAVEGSVLHPVEQAWMRSVATEARERMFLVYWTRKEAVLKATGEGLRCPPTAVVTGPADREPRLLEASRRDLYERASLARLVHDRAIGHVAVVVPEGGPRRPVVVEQHADPLASRAAR
jgi:4'-phosphopantetheinyl transferase